MLIGREGRRRAVTALDAVAESLGLRIGMAAATAQALAPGLIVIDADPKADAEGLGKLALWTLQRISPGVMPDPPDGLVIDTTVAQTPAEILERYTFFSHIGNALALWRHTHPAEFWTKWQAEHPASAAPEENATASSQAAEPAATTEPATAQ